MAQRVTWPDNICDVGMTSFHGLWTHDDICALERLSKRYALDGWITPTAYLAHEFDGVCSDSNSVEGASEHFSPYFERGHQRHLPAYFDIRETEHLSTVVVQLALMGGKSLVRGECT